MLPEEGHAPDERPERESERDVLAERRARRAWLSSPALARRAEAAEATARTLEAHLTDLRRRQVEVERERELASAQLAERELQLRRVKQREHAEQQLRVEAEEAAVRQRRAHRAELDRLQRRAEEAHAAALHAEEQREELAAHLAGVGESCARLQRSVAALQHVAAGLRTLERDHAAAQIRVRELEGELKRALARAVPPARGATPAHAAPPAHAGPPPLATPPGFAPAAVHAVTPAQGDGLEAEDVRREEMAGALAAAVERLRARASAPAQDAAEASAAAATEQPALPSSAPPEIPTLYVVPRLFAAPAPGERSKLSHRLAPAVRRLAARLAAWADV